MRIHEARADSDVSVCWNRWLALAETETLDLCDAHGQQRAAFVGRGQDLRFLNRKQAVQQVWAIAQVRKARLSHPSRQNLGQDPLPRVASLLWLVLQSRWQPRVIKGLGSCSHQVQTKQGCMPFGHHFVEFSVLQDASTACTAAFIGVFWSTIGPPTGPHSVLMAFARLLMRLMTPLSRSPSWKVSFLLASQALFFSHARVERRVRPFVLMKVKGPMRDLGHEHPGPYARRLVERERMAPGVRSLPRLRRFRKAVGKKATALFWRDSRHLGAMGRPRWVCCRALSRPIVRLRLNTRFEQVTKSFDGICVGTPCQVRSIVCCYSPSGAGVRDSALGWPHQPRLAGSCAQGLG